MTDRFDRSEKAISAWSQLSVALISHIKNEICPVIRVGRKRNAVFTHFHIASGLLFLSSIVKKKNSVRAVLLLVSLLEAFALPESVGRATQKPHAEYDTALLSRSRKTISIYTIIFQGIYHCCTPWRILKVAKFQAVKNERLVNAIIKKIKTHPLSPYRLLLSRSTTQNYKFLINLQNKMPHVVDF